MHCWKASLKNGEGPGKLVYMGRCYLDQFSMIEEADRIPQFLLPIVLPVLTFFRGVLAMAWSLPNAFGCTMRDVLYLFPDRKTTPLAKDVDKVGRYLLSTVTEDELWIARKGLYKDCTGVEATLGNPVWLAYVESRTSVVEPTFEK